MKLMKTTRVIKGVYNGKIHIHRKTFKNSNVLSFCPWLLGLILNSYFAICLFRTAI